MIKRVIIKAEGVAIMANTSINIRMDADLKRQFEAFCADMGMTMTTSFNVFARKAVRDVYKRQFQSLLLIHHSLHLFSYILQTHRRCV